MALGAQRYRGPAEDLLERARARRDDPSLTPEAREAIAETIDELKAKARRESARTRALRDGAVRALLAVVEGEPDLQAKAFALMSLGETGAKEGVAAIRRILEKKSHRLKAWSKSSLINVRTWEAFL